MNPDPEKPLSTDADPYDSPARKRWIFVCVLTIHLVVIAIPCLYFLYVEYKKPKTIVIKAALVNLPKGNTLDVPENTQTDPVPSAETPVSDPVADMPDFPDIAPLKEVKPLPELPPPPPPPKNVPPKPVPPKPLPPKPVPPKKDPPPPPPKKVPPKKVVDKPKSAEKPVKKYLTAEDIAEARKKKPRIVKTQTDRAAEERARAQAKAIAEANAKARANAEAASRRAAQERAKILADTASAVKVYGSPLGGEQGTPATTEFYDYLDKLTAILRQRWKEPKSIELNARRLEVKLLLSIASDGTVNAKEFTPSGNRIMDKSVSDLLEKITVVPQPPHAMKVPVTLRVSE